MLRLIIAARIQSICRGLKRQGNVGLSLEQRDYPPTPTMRVASSSHFCVSPSVQPGTA